MLLLISLILIAGFKLPPLFYAGAIFWSSCCYHLEKAGKELEKAGKK